MGKIIQNLIGFFIHNVRDKCLLTCFNKEMGLYQLCYSLSGICLVLLYALCHEFFQTSCVPSCVRLKYSSCLSWSSSTSMLISNLYLQIPLACSPILHFQFKQKLQQHPAPVLSINPGSISTPSPLPINAAS